MDQKLAQSNFFRVIYDPVLRADGSLADGHQIRIFQNNGEQQLVNFFTNIDSMLNYCNFNRRQADTYFTLSTTNGRSGQAADLVTRTILAFDFDGVTASDVMFQFGKLGLKYHSLIDSGHGFHAYMCINPTSDHALIEQVQRELCERLQADPNAAKVTQLLRVPGTLNLKSAVKPVNVVNNYALSTVKRYDINKLYNDYCRYSRPKDAPARVILATTRVPACIEEMIRSGSIEGERNSNLMNLVVTLRKRGKTLNQIMNLCKQWAGNSGFDDALEYRVRYIYENQNSVKMDCTGCKHYFECYAKIESDFNLPDDYCVLKMSEAHIRRLAAKRGEREMKPNDLMVYGLLKGHDDGLTVDEIQIELTYKGKQVIGEKSIRLALKNLEENGFIKFYENGSSHKKTYLPVDVQSSPDLVFYISYAAIAEAIRGNITPEELRLYTYIRYIHHKQQRDRETGLNGNLFVYNQKKLAADLGLTQGRISQMINRLLDERLMTIWYRQQSKNTGWDFNIYRLLY